MKSLQVHLQVYPPCPKKTSKQTFPSEDQAHWNKMIQKGIDGRRTANSSGRFKKSTETLHKDKRLHLKRDLQIENGEP